MSATRKPSRREIKNNAKMAAGCGLSSRARLRIKAIVFSSSTEVSNNLVDES
jgi:hypothetical protein